MIGQATYNQEDPLGKKLKTLKPEPMEDASQAVVMNYKAEVDTLKTNYSNILILITYENWGNNFIFRKQLGQYLLEWCSHLL